MSKVAMTPEQIALSNALVTGLTQQAVSIYVEQRTANAPSVAASLVSSAFMAAALGLLKTLEVHAGLEVDRDAVRRTFENMLADPGTFIPPDGSAPPTQHFN